MYAAIAILCGVGFIFVLIATFFLVRSLVLISRGNAVTGRVIQMQRISDSEGGDTFLPIFEYQWGGQTFVRGAGLATSPPRYRVGDTATLYVDPAKPSDALPNRFVDLWLMPLVFGGVAGILAVVAVVIFFVS